MNDQRLPLTVTVKLFAAYQEAYGKPELRMELPAGALVATVRDRLIAEHPQLEPWRDLTRFGINLDFAEPDTPLQDGDEIVLIPPVSGGTAKKVETPTAELKADNPG